MDDLISRQAAIDGFYEMASDIDRLCTVSDYVHFLETMTSAQPEDRCGECDAWNQYKNYPSAQLAQDLTKGCTDTISRQEAIDTLAEDMPQPYTPDGSHPADEGIFMAQEIYADCIQTLKELPSAHPEWNNHTVACLLAELFNDTCACNYKDIDEWLPEKCELLDSCPNPGGVACWEQFLKHKAERRTDGN